MDPRLRRLRRPLPVLLAVSVLALLARLYALGWRVAHQDESRVADWTLHYMATGTWRYRPIIHGPFLPHVNGVVFSLLGPSDFTMRLVPAVFGALLPLAAYCYRDHLDDAEVVALGVLFAASPALLYYSRFMRNDLMVAACMLAAVGFALRARASGKARYLYAGTFCVALAFTMKGNALLYPVAWVGAGALVVDRRLLLARLTERGPVGTAGDLLVEMGRGLRPWVGPLALALVEWLLVVALFYAPLPGLYGAFASPNALLGVAREATLGTLGQFVSTWTGSNMSQHSTPEFLWRLSKTLALTATVTCVGAVVGFCRERYGAGESRALVEFCFFWGALSVLGYGIITDVMGGWVAVNVVAPLAVPAAVGLAWVGRVGVRGYREGDAVAFRAAAAVLLVSAGILGGTAAYTGYAAPQSPSNPLVQFAQPSGHMKPTLDEIRTLSEHHDGIDVLFYGSTFSNPTDLRTTPTLDVKTGGYPGWFARLPLPWYFDQYGARVGSTTDAKTLTADEPPVVIALANQRSTVASALNASDYTVRTYPRYQRGQRLVFFVRQSS